MQKKIMNVFYGNDCLPYKDVERTVHFPIVGTGFTGASDTTEIRFYVDRIGGVYTTKWVANTKLPNGKKGYKLLDQNRDSTLGENYVSLSLTQFYTQVRGDVYISLQGYDGGVQLSQDEDDNYIVVGTPTIQATGSIKITMQYAVNILPSDIQEYISLDDILAYITCKADVDYVDGNFLRTIKVDSNGAYWTTKTLKQLLEDNDLITNFVEGEIAIFGLSLDLGTNAEQKLVYVRLNDENSAEVWFFDWADYRLTSGSNSNASLSSPISIAISGAGSVGIATLTDLARYYTSTEVDTLLNAKANDNAVVHNTGNETISGNKTFSGKVLVNNPTDNNQATPKSYVDNLVSTIKQDNIVVVNTTTYPTLNDFLASTGEEGDIYLYPLDTTDLSKGYYRYVWENNSWLALGTTDIDLSDYYTKSETNTLLSGKQDTLTFDNAPTQNSNNPVKSGGVYTALGGKQDTLVSGTNIKTINNQSILGSGNITIQGGGGGTWGTITGDIDDQTDLQNEFNEIRQVAEGKCKAVVISYLDTYDNICNYLGNNPTKKVYLVSDGSDITTDFLNGTGWTSGMISNGLFNSNNLFIEAVYFIAEKDGNGDYLLYQIDPRTTPRDLKTGDVIYVKETDVPDRWFDDYGYFNSLETTKVDLSNYVDLSSNQTITGAKTFISEIAFKRNASATNSFEFVYSPNTTDLILMFNYSNRVSFGADGSIVPYINNNANLGSLTKKYISVFTNSFNANSSGYGLSLPDTSSWTANKEIATTDTTFNVINASDIVSNTLTQAQFDLITNGKPTIISGTFLGYDNPILLSCELSSGSVWQYLGRLLGEKNNGWYDCTYEIDNRTNVISVNSVQFRSYGGRFFFKEKEIPAYPSSPTIPQELIYDTDNTLKYQNVSGFKVIAPPSSITLTDDEIATIIKGVQIDGTFLGMTNPLLHKASDTPSYYYGIIEGNTGSLESTIGFYFIIKSNKQIYTGGNTEAYVALKSIKAINGKTLPAYPSSTGTFVLKCVDGVLTWVQEV